MYARKNAFNLDLFFKAKNKGTKPNHARNSKLNLGKDKISKTADSIQRDNSFTMNSEL